MNPFLTFEGADMRPVILVAAIVVLGLAILVCVQLVPHYQIIPSIEGSAWRLNTSTGEMTWCGPGKSGCYTAVQK